ncbi:MAG: hypothetical protein ABSG68_11355 [Thermoguttaceae bacterium]|jgi:hypothetical protein
MAYSSSLATLRPDITPGLEEFDLLADIEGFSTTEVLPVFDAPEKAGTFGQIPLEQLLERRDTARTPTGGFNRGNWEFVPHSFACTTHGLEEPIDDEEQTMYRNYFDLEMVSARRAQHGLLHDMEYRGAAKVFNTTTWTGAALTAAVSIAWTLANAATAVPLSDVAAAIQSMWLNSGLWANAVVMSRLRFHALRQCEQVIERIGVLAGGAGQKVLPSKITRELMAQAFDVDKVIVAGSPKNTANVGEAKSLASIWSADMCMVCRVAVTNDYREPCIGRTLHWGEAGSTIGGTVETYRDETIKSDIVRCSNCTDEHILLPQAGFLLTNVNGGTA